MTPRSAAIERIDTMPPVAPPSDEAGTVARAREGDRDAMRRLYLDTVGILTRFVARRVPAHQIDDVVSETYARALAKLPQYRVQGVPVRAWLLRIAWHLIIDTGRSGAARTVLLANPGDVGAGADPTAAWIDRHDARTELRRAFAALQPGQRTAVGLRHLEGLPTAEVAVVLGISEPAVRALVYRGLLALRRSMARHESGQSGMPWTPATAGALS